jgi:cell division protein FtsZ
LVINNEKLREMYGDLALSDAFGKADNILAIAAKGIAEIIEQSQPHLATLGIIFR